ncbi:MAG: DUF1499 domain-containing protein [Pseudomonadota bacterium]
MALWLLGLAALAALSAAIYFRVVPDDPAVWHVDPATAERTGRPNDYVIAPESLSDIDADLASPVFAIPPRDLMFLFDSVASAGGMRIAGSVDEMHATYVQRSMVLGYPDYISVRAVEVEGGSALVIYSRSRFGYSDMGVNKARIDRWLAQLG